jgi:prevent-host-death family protein
MRTVDVKDAEAGFSGLVDEARRGAFVTITRHGEPVAALVSVEAAAIARKAMGKRRAGLVAYLRTFPGESFERNCTPFRASIELGH